MVTAVPQRGKGLALLISDGDLRKGSQKLPRVAFSEVFVVNGENSVDERCSQLGNNLGRKKAQQKR